MKRKIFEDVMSRYVEPQWGGKSDEQRAKGTAAAASANRLKEYLAKRVKAREIKAAECSPR